MDGREPLAKGGHLRAQGAWFSGVPGPGDQVGVNEIVRWGATIADMDDLAELVASAIRADDPAAMAEKVTSWRAAFNLVRYCAP